jgi:hypothetical protein
MRTIARAALLAGVAVLIAGCADEPAPQYQATVSQDPQSSMADLHNLAEQEYRTAVSKGLLSPAAQSTAQPQSATQWKSPEMLDLHNLAEREYAISRAQAMQQQTNAANIAIAAMMAARPMPMPVYSQPVYSQPVYSQPVYSQPAPTHCNIFSYAPGMANMSCN